MTINSTRVLCIGLDGATLDVVEPLAEIGYLPNLRALMERGAWGRLDSTRPPLSPPAWATFATGVNPGVHGVFDFVTRAEDGTFRVANGASLRQPTFWARLSAAGRTVGVVNVPLTYPPTPVNGFMVSGMDAPRKSTPTTYPPDLAAEIVARFGTYWVERHTASLLPLSSRRFLSRYVADTLAMMRRRGQVTRWLLESYRPELLVVVFIGTDRLQHLDGQALEAITSRRGLDRAALADNPVAAAYRTADQEIGHLLEAVDSTWHIVVMSDHGFRPYERVFNLNRWLMEQGFLALKPRRWPPRVGGPLQGLWARLRGRVAGTGVPGPLERFLAAVDWPHTVAYSFGAFGSLYLNLRGREPHGVVATVAEGEALLAAIAEKLQTWRDPETGAAVIARVERGQGLYKGPMAGWGPDLVMEMAPGYFIRNSLETWSSRLVEPAGQYAGRQLPHTAMHDPQGLLIMAGPAARKAAAQPAHAGIIDLAPTLLYLAGEPVPSSLEGKVLVDWLDAHYVAQHPVRHGDGEVGATGLAHDYTPEEERIVAAHLQRLGYLL